MSKSSNARIFRRMVPWVCSLGLICGTGWVKAEDSAVTTQPSASAPATEPAKLPKGVHVRTPEMASRPAARKLAKWEKKHDQLVADTKANAEAQLVFVGDSITDFWNSKPEDQPSFADHFGKYHALDLGVSGDLTDHVLWRLANGEGDGLHPKAIVLMIGTNNLGHELPDQPEWVAGGVKAVIDSLHQKMPEAKILLLAIFPRAEHDSAIRKAIEQTNQLIAKFADDKTIFLDIGQSFLDGNGDIPKDIMPDGLHPSPQGYEIWAKAMQPTLELLMK